MGTYTELILGCRLKKSTPNEIVEALKSMVYDLDIAKDNPILNEFWHVLAGGSYYFAVHTSVKKMWFDDICNEWAISSRSNIKNYGGEIEKFLAWIKPYIESGSGSREMYAIVIYEESETPTMYYLD